jgi:hypothetical protein
MLQTGLELTLKLMENVDLNTCTEVTDFRRELNMKRLVQSFFKQN